MDVLQSLFDAITPRRDCDVIDRLSYCYTFSLLAVFAIVIAGWEFVGTPISCWFPAYFKGWWEEYALDYCYVQNTYFWPLVNGGITRNVTHAAAEINQIPIEIPRRDEGLIPYYQWVPFFLAFQAFCFYLPVVLWRAFNSQFGLATDTILVTATKSENMNEEERTKSMDIIAKFLYHGIRVEDKVGNNRYSRAYRHSHVTLLHLTVKVLYFINAVVQFFLLGAFLDYDWYWGFVTLRDIGNGVSWAESGHFPRVTLCDFEVRELGNLHRHTVQCVLMINMFSEKIFVFLWFWYLFVMVITCLSMIEWTMQLFTTKTNEKLIEQYILRQDPKAMKSNLRKFINRHLQTDGLFLTKMIGVNAGETVSLALIGQMWRAFKEQLSQDSSKSDIIKEKQGGQNGTARKSPPVQLATKASLPKYNTYQSSDV